MAKLKLTASNVDNLQSQNGRRTDYWDTVQRGLALRVSPSGKRSWIAFYRTGRRFRRLTLADYPTMGLADARKKANTAMLQVADGRDPAAEKVRRRDEITFEDLAKHYIDQYAKTNKRTWLEDQRILESDDVAKTIGKARARDITRGQIRTLLESIVSRGAPYAANRKFSVIRKVFNWALEREDIYGITVSPCDHLSAPGDEEERTRVLADGELKLLWDSIEAESSSMIKGVFKMLLLTAQRCGEVKGMKWEEIDFVARTWTIPGERTKNKLNHVVPLAPAALEILESLKAEKDASEIERIKKSAFVFQSPHGTLGPIGDIHNATRRILQRINSDQNGEPLKEPKIEDARPHDFRRTAATRMEELGVPYDIVGRILNHKKKGITGVYARYDYVPEKRDGLEKWARTLSIVVSGLKLVSVGAAGSAGVAK